MKKYRHYIIMLFCGILMCTKTAYAQVPVFDFTEIRPIYKDVKDAIETVKDLKEQLSMIDGTLNAIGKEMNSFATFGKGIKKSIGSGKKAAANASSTTKNGEDTTKQTTTTTSNESSSTVNTQKEIVDDYVDQTQEAIGGRKNLKIPTDGLPFKISQNIEIRNILFEEEEEEEEIDANSLEEEIRELQTSVLAEQKQLAVELNDVLDAQLTLLNKSAVDNEKALKDLNVSIQQMKKITPDDKKRLQNKILQISEKQRQADDWAIKIVESVKENYNKEYNARIKDGINNYTKVVVAYIRGDETSEGVAKAGEKLKKSVASINVTPDAGVLGELYQTVADVRLEVEMLASEVNELLSNT